MKPVQHLTIAQVRMLKEFTDPRSADTLAIQMACGVTKEEAEWFFDTVPAGELLRCLEEIFDLSGLGEGAQFPSRSVDDAGDVGSAVAG